MIGEQLFQIIARTAFYNYGPGYLSVFAITIRIYSAFRFILVDSFIGSRLANWQHEFKHGNRTILKMMNSTSLSIMIAFIALFISLKSNLDLAYSTIQIILILMCGFYFSTLVRLIYFKINQRENNSQLIIRFAMYELICALIAFLLTKQLNYPILAMLWIGYIAKPFAQLLLLRKRYDGLELS